VSCSAIASRARILSHIHKGNVVRGCDKTWKDTAWSTKTAWKHEIFVANYFTSLALISYNSDVPTTRFLSWTYTLKSSRLRTSSKMNINSTVSTEPVLVQPVVQSSLAWTPRQIMLAVGTIFVIWLISAIVRFVQYRRSYKELVWTSDFTRFCDSYVSNIWSRAVVYLLYQYRSSLVQFLQWQRCIRTAQWIHILMALWRCCGGSIN